MQSSPTPTTQARHGPSAQNLPVRNVPVGATDCHVHVFGPFHLFPLDPQRNYTPGEASVASLLALHRSLGLQRVVVVQASPQGSDNACLLDALKQLNTMGHAARGVAVISGHESDADLQAMHAAGVRGVRVNLESAGQHDPRVGQQLMQQAAERVAPWGWHVQTYTTLDVVAAMHDTLAQLPTPVVIDHFGRADASKGTAQAGFDALLSLVRTGKAWIKLSAVQRISTATDCADAEPIARALIAACPDHMLWGTDWPHPGAWPGVQRRREALEPFHPVDDQRALARLAQWTTPDQWRAVLTTNPAALYGF